MITGISLNSCLLEKHSNLISHIVTIPPGTHMLSEQLSRTPIVRGEGAGVDTGMGENFVDDNIDPELAEALRLSMLQAEQDNKNREQKVNIYCIGYSSFLFY
jgi:26S proteasome regulatory subunit N10